MTRIAHAVGVASLAIRPRTVGVVAYRAGTGTVGVTTATSDGDGMPVGACAGRLRAVTMGDDLASADLSHQGGVSRVNNAKPLIDLRQAEAVIGHVAAIGKADGCKQARIVSAQHGAPSHSSVPCGAATPAKVMTWPGMWVLAGTPVIFAQSR